MKQGGGEEGMESRRTMRRAEEPEWSPKGRAKLRLPFQSFCLSGALLLAPPPPRARLRLPVFTCLSLSFASLTVPLPSGQFGAKSCANCKKFAAANSVICHKSDIFFFFFLLTGFVAKFGQFLGAYLILNLIQFWIQLSLLPVPTGTGLPSVPHLSNWKCWIPFFFFFFVFARADFIHADVAPARQCLGDKCLSPVCVLSIFPNYINRTNRRQPERRGRETKEQRVLNFKQSRRPPYQVWTPPVCVSVWWLSWWHFILNVYNGTLWLWKEECRTEKKVCSWPAV